MASRLLLATPMYDHRCHGAYFGSVLKLARSVEFDILSLTGCCFIDVAREEIVKQFLAGPWSHLLFIDSDLGFEAQGVLKMLAYCNDEKYQIMGAGCPKRELSWKKIKEAALAGDDEDTLPYRGTNWNYNLALPTEFNPEFPLEVSEIGTGIMVIRREVFDKLTPPYFVSGWQQKEVNEKIEHEYMGEDIMFCRRYRESGGKVWMAPWVLTNHMGIMAYKGDIRKANLTY
jgi:hypothetical protein